MIKTPGGWRAMQQKNWASGPHNLHGPSSEPSAWDRLLREMALTDEGALRLLVDRRTKEARRITGFVVRNMHKKYVPETVLQTLGEVVIV